MDALLRRRQMMLAGGTPTPLPYTPVEFIQTDGTAYINTGIKAGSPVAISVDMKVTFVANGGKMMGARDSARRVIPVALSSNGILSLGFYDFYNVVDVTSSVTNKTPIYIKCSMQKDSQVMQVKLDGESSYSTYTKTDRATINSTLNQYLFAHNYSSGKENVANGTKLFYCKIYSDTNYTNLVFDAVPCYYNGAYGLWDRVSDSFFGNAAGSGAFTGPSI